VAKVTGSQLKVKVSQQSVQPVPASPKASLMKDSEGGDSRYQGRGAFLPGQRMVFVRCFWRAGTVRVPARPGYAGIPPARYAGYAGILPARQRPGYAGILPACSGLGTRASCPHAAARVRGHPARKAAAWVRGHLARMQRPGYAGILPARQRPGYAGILPACSGVTCHGSESIMKIENL
jgi:hypothetical protein